ncbi:MAG TPA: LPXTG cell wall anchor domain-containing protein, partial [Planctomycetota bacterium]|nr:LPXTG cell wall anchor domain-containing protein [Planctomycetota bacterium]
MGKEIVYCQGCGTNLREEDFEKGRAHRVENRPFCVECKPAPPPKAETPRPRKTSTGRIPLATPPGARRPVLPKTAKTANLTLIIGGAIAALVVLMLLIVMASRSGRPRPPASSAPEQGTAPAPVPDAGPTDDSTDVRLAQIREILRSDPLFMRRAEAVRRMDDARREAGPRAGEIDRLRADYD